MPRKSYVQINGVLYDKAELQGVENSAGVGAPAIIADAPAFVSPIDGSVVNGRAALRDHCARHGVVPTAELKGLPPKPFVECRKALWFSCWNGSSCTPSLRQ
mgnify:CR=1 FL=1